MGIQQFGTETNQWALEMLSSANLETLLSVLNDKEKPLDHITKTFYKTFTKNDRYIISAAVFSHSQFSNRLLVTCTNRRTPPQHPINNGGLIHSIWSLPNGHQPHIKSVLSRVFNSTSKRKRNRRILHGLPPSRPQSATRCKTNFWITENNDFSLKNNPFIKLCNFMRGVSYPQNTKYPKTKLPN